MRKSLCVYRNKNAAKNIYHNILFLLPFHYGHNIQSYIYISYNITVAYYRDYVTADRDWAIGFYNPN